jgi:hypothetical protein
MVLERSESAGRFLRATRCRVIPMHTKLDRKRLGLAVGAEVDGSCRTARSWSAIICTEPWKFTIPLDGGISATSILGMLGKSGILIPDVLWSRKMMIYRIVTYDKRTGRMAGNLPLQWQFVAQVRKIAGVQPTDDGLGEYPLAKEKIKKISMLLHIRPEPDLFDYYLEPYEQPDNGLHQEISIQ